MTEPCVSLDVVADGVTRITLDRPTTLNAMTVDLVVELHRALDRVAADASCRVVILTGAGRGFCSGLDLNGFGVVPGTEQQGAVPRSLAVQQAIAELVPHLRRVPQPVIAAVNGPAAGGGFALVLGSDIRLAARSATFSAAFIRIGVSACDIGTSWLLPRLIGAARAQELMLTGRLFEAEEAARIGLVTDVVDDDRLLDRALAHAELLMANAPMAVRMTKRVMWSALEVPGQQAALDLENHTQVMLLATADHHEAIRARQERRAADYVDG
ncbi:MAG TPA: enoyl-CoA hydratase-related protein [Acidimicrobiales bacterium]|nr:enoyl-CoA hydratase-related protein [Acidimicrobiales bacterium]